MSRGGVVVDRVVECPGIGSGQAAEALVALVGEPGDYHAVRVASDRVQFARTFRPTWATIVGWCLLPVLFIGVVFFFVKTTETCVAAIEADHRGTRIRLSGRLDATVLERILATFNDPAAAVRDAQLAAAVGAPVDSANPPPQAWPAASPPSPSAPQGAPVGMAPPSGAPVGMAPPSGAPVGMAPPSGAPAAMAPPSGVPVGMAPPSGVPVGMAPPSGAPAAMVPPEGMAPPPPAPTPTPAPAAATPTPAAPVTPSVPTPSVPASNGWVPVWERDDVDVAVGDSSGSGLRFDPSSTIVVPKQRAGGAPALRAVLDDGTELDLSTVVLLGRDPAAGPGEQRADLVAVADPERSVSKTHLKVEVLGGVVLATDRGSTNGSALIGPDGTITDLEAGQAVEVPAGSAVRFGSRTVRVLSTASLGGGS